MCKQNLALDNLQGFIFHKTQPKTIYMSVYVVRDNIRRFKLRLLIQLPLMITFMLSIPLYKYIVEKVESCLFHRPVANKSLMGISDGFMLLPKYQFKVPTRFLTQITNSNFQPIHFMVIFK